MTAATTKSSGSPANKALIERRFATKTRTRAEETARPCPAFAKRKHSNIVLLGLGWGRGRAEDPNADREIRDHGARQSWPAQLCIGLPAIPSDSRVAGRRQPSINPRSSSTSNCDIVSEPGTALANHERPDRAHPENSIFRGWLAVEQQVTGISSG